MKVFQDGRKALMFKQYKTLGEWILRDLLNRLENTIITYDVLSSVGIDVVSFEKIDVICHLDFAKIGWYDEFLYEIVLLMYKNVTEN